MTNMISTIECEEEDKENWKDEYIKFLEQENDELNKKLKGYEEVKHDIHDTD